MKTAASSFGDFKCGHCHVLVSSAHTVSGVRNRNHCPYCLWSCHLDLYAAGDRLCACKGQMEPVGLTMKVSRNKYRLDGRGELMLVHQCVECGTLSINRVAADDDSSTIMTVFQESLTNDIHSLCEGYGIRMLIAQDLDAVHQQLYGNALGIPVL